MRSNCCTIAVLRPPGRVLLFLVTNTFISEGAAVNRRLWPARSPDLNPCDFYLCDTLKSKVYANNPHSLEELKISGTKMEPFRRTNCSELLDMYSGDVCLPDSKDIISNMNCEFGTYIIKQYLPQKCRTNPPHVVTSLRMNQPPWVRLEVLTLHGSPGNIAMKNVQ